MHDIRSCYSPRRCLIILIRIRQVTCHSYRNNFLLGVDRYQESPCPVIGEYTGAIPDEPTLCAKLYSDCNNPEIMFYTVSDCDDKSLIYEGI